MLKREEINPKDIIPLQDKLNGLNITLIECPVYIRETIDEMKRLLPNMKKIVLISDRHYVSAQIREKMRHVCETYFPDLDVSYFIEGNVSAELLAALYQSQLAKKSQDNFLNPDRYYINLVKKIISEGQKKGEIRTDISVEELAHDVLVLERGIIMDWCVQNGSFSLGYYGSRSFDLYIEFMRIG